MIWEKPGTRNTADTVELAVEKAKAEGIKHLVVASNSGSTAEKCLREDLQVVCVTHQVGFKDPGRDEMPSQKRTQLEELGVKVLTTSHFLAGVDRALRFKEGGLYPAEIVAHTLRMMGQGVKVCLEISVMALDAGLIPYGKEVVAVGGTGRGADTALLLTPEHGQNLFDTRIHEIICKPGLRKNKKVP